MTYPLINGAEINGMAGASSGARKLYAASVPEATAYGTAVAVMEAPVGPDIAIARQSGPRTTHGIPTAFCAPAASAARAVAAARSAPSTAHGRPGAKELTPLQAAGALPTVMHGTVSAASAVRALGASSTQHARADALAIVRASGTRGTSHGTAGAAAALSAAGNLATRSGAHTIVSPVIRISAIGHGGSQHGTSRIGRVGMYAFSSLAGMRHGKPTVLRGNIC